MKAKTMTPAEYVKRPYARVVVPESDGTFSAEILEFPGCLATGETASEALTSLEEIAFDWIEATLARGQRVPEPLEGSQFSGKLVLRLPRALHRKAAIAAARNGVSLNQFIVSSVAEQVGEERQRRVVAYDSNVRTVNYLALTNVNVYGAATSSLGATTLLTASAATGTAWFAVLPRILETADFLHHSTAHSACGRGNPKSCFHPF